MATVPILEKAGRLTEVRACMFNLIADNWTTPTGEVHLPAQYLLTIAAR
jgi:hypothetical protein